MKYFIDLDNVLFDFDGIMSSLRPDYNPKKWDLPEDIQKFHDENLGFIYTYMKPIPSEIAAAQRVECEIITARPEAVEAITRKAVRQAMLDAPVNFVRSENKVDYIYTHYTGVGEQVILIDDKPETIQEAINFGIEAYLFLRPHNVGSKLPTIRSIWEVMYARW